MALKDFKVNSIVEHNGKYYRLVNRCGGVIIVSDGFVEYELLAEQCSIVPQMYYTDVFIIDTKTKSEIDIDWDNGIEDTFADYNTSIDVATELLCEHTKPNYLVCVSVYELMFNLTEQSWELPHENHKLAFRCVNCSAELADMYNIKDYTISIANLYIKK